MKKLNVTWDIRKEGKTLYHHWSKCVGAGRANEGLRTAWQKQLKTIHDECGFEYIRFHGLLCDDMFVYSEENGQPVYNWSYVDELFDFITGIGMKPFVEFGFMPEALASGTGTQFWWKGNITPAKDNDKWAALLKAAVEHWIERYGFDEVVTWYFEIWNEPNLWAFWNGTRSQYFAMYHASVLAIKSIDERLRVGGPATSNFVPDERFDGEKEDFTKHKTFMVDDINTLEWHGVWIESFLNYCADNNLPVDFVSCHPYPTDFALDGQDVPEGQPTEFQGRSRYRDCLKDDLTWLKNMIKNSAYPDVEIHLTEWSSSPTSRDYSHDHLPAANYVVKSNIDNTGMTDSLSYWVFTDIFEEVGGGPQALHGGFGLMNMQGLRKPTYHAYRMLHNLGTQEIERGDEYIMTKTEDGKLRGLIYNYADELTDSVPISEYPDYTKAQNFQAMGSYKEINMTIAGLSAGDRVQVEVLDVKHGCIAEAWKNMGYPRNLTKEQTAKLHEVSQATDITEYVADEEGKVIINTIIGTWAIAAINQL